MTHRTHEEISVLLGAYALDAVDPDERDAVVEHLPTCPRCRAELRDHVEVAGILGDEGAPAPDGVWDRIALEIADGDDESSLPALDLDAVRSERRSPARRRPRPRVLAVAAAVLVAVALGSLGAVIADQQSRLDEMEDEMHGDVALADPSSEVVPMSAPDGTMYATAVVAGDGQALLVSADLAPLPDHRTYQLWAVGSDGPVSLGMLGADPAVVPFRISGEMPMTLAITEEPASGSTAPTTEPMATGELTSL